MTTLIQQLRTRIQDRLVAERGVVPGLANWRRHQSGTALAA